MEPHLLGLYLGLLLTACLVAAAAEYLKRPYSIALVIVGLVAGLFRLAPEITIGKEATFHLLLPPLLFHGAFHMDLEDLKKNWRAIALLAIPGVLVSTFLIGWGVHMLWGVGLLYGLLFGAMITPTDPVSVLAILGSVGAPKRLRVILEGESLFNDGTGVVLFAVILALIMDGGAFHPIGSILKFVAVAGGGAAVGVALGAVVHQALKRLENHLIEVSLTIVLAFGAPLVAEAFHLSGVIAAVTAGLVVGNYGRIFAMSERTRVAVEHFWEVVEFVVNSFLFLAIGLELQVISLSRLADSFWLILIGVALVQLGRAMATYPMFYTKRLVVKDAVPTEWIHVFYWGGLKGAIPLALTVGLPADFPHRDLFLMASFSVVLVSLLVQGLTMSRLLTALGLDNPRA